MITPADSPSSPSGYAGVAASGFDIQAPMADLQATFDASVAAAGPGVEGLGPMSDRQSAARELLESPPGYADFTILGGTTAGWPADVTP